MIEILNIWIKIVAIIALWEAWKYVGWRIACWIVDRQVKKYEKQHGDDISKCPYLNNKDNV